MSRLGRHQLRLLLTLGSPSMRLVVANKVSRSLEARGLVRAQSPDGNGLVQITPAGLRALADAFEAGHLEQFFEKDPFAPEYQPEAER